MKEDEEREKERERKRGELGGGGGGGKEERKKRRVVLNGTSLTSCIRYEGRGDNAVFGLGKCATVSCCCALSA